MYSSVGAFVQGLEQAGELVRVNRPVSAVLEVAQIADMMSKRPAPSPPSAAARASDPRFYARGGKAVLFSQVEGADFPLLINAWGSYKRLEMALDCHDLGRTPGGFEAIGSRIAELVKPQPPRGLREAWDKARQFLPLLTIAPRRRKGDGLCQQVVKTGPQIDLTRLPILRCWPHDGNFAALGYPAGVNDQVQGISRGDDWNAKFRGRYITLAGIHTVHADDAASAKPASHNIGMYRVQLLGPDRVAMHWHMHHDGARHWRSWKKLGRRMPVAIVLGGESVMPYAATAPLPPGISELLLAGFLNRGGIPMVRAKSVPLWVPANAEIVIEGWVSPEAGFIDYDPRSGEAIGPGAVFEGPFGDHTGFYSLPDRYPLVEVTAVTHRTDAIYPTTVVGLPPQEDYYLGKATERVFLPLLKTIVHDIDDYDLPQFGAFHNCAMVKITKAYPLQGRRIMHSVWGAGQMAWTKCVMVVDGECNVHDTFAVLRACAIHCHPLRDVELVHGPLDILDHAAPFVGAGTKLGFDATHKRTGESVHGIPTDDASPLAPTRLAPMTDMEAAHYLHAITALPGVTGASLPETLARGWLMVTIDKPAPAIAQPGPSGIDTLKAIYQLDAGALAIGQSSLPPFVIVLSHGVDLADPDAALFHWLAHFDAGRDVLRWQSGDRRTHRMGMDATVKSPADTRLGVPARAWPPVLKMDPKIIERVGARWTELGLGERGLGERGPGDA